MKIGILTFANVPNFGANLQALSTISYLQNHGYNPILIKWEPEDFEARFTSIKTQKQPQEHFHFVEKYFPQTKICRNDDDICQVIKDEKIEGIIIGSDAVLQCSSFWGRLDFPTKTVVRVNKATSEREYPNAFWGTFYDKLRSKIPMVIMSASSQNAKYRLIARSVKHKMSNNLSHFEYISVRDIWTRDMITYITKGAIIPNITPDPVFAFNYNCAKFIPSKEDILLKYHLPENYVLVSMKCRMLDNMLWMDKLKSEMKKLYLECVALPMPTGIEFKHNFDFSITTPLPPLDWYALIKYAKGYIGENMHPIVVALHNAVPCFCFDTYGVLKYARCVCVEESSKIYDIMSRFSLLDNRINAYSRFWKCPPVDIVINQILHFDVIACQKTALNYYNNYEQMMSSILEVFKSK